MSAMSDVDRQLRSLLEADGPQSLPDDLLETAFAEARTVRQRRPLVGALDPLAWPRPSLAVPAAMGRLLVLALVGSLLAVLVAGLLLVAAPRPVLGGATRAYIWSEGVAHVLTPEGAAAYTPTVDRAVGGCGGVVVGGADVVANIGFGELVLRRLGMDTVVGTISTDYAGGERWSEDRRHLALMDFAGRVGIVEPGAGADATARWVDVPDVRHVEWLPTGDLIVARQVGETLDIERLDAGALQRTPLVRLPEGLAPPDTWNAAASPDGRWLALVLQAEDEDLRIVDLTSGAIHRSRAPGASSRISWSPDSSTIAVLPDGSSTVWFVGPTGEVRELDAMPGGEIRRDLHWSPDSASIALVSGRATAPTLHVLDRVGGNHRSAPAGLDAAIAWAASDALLVARSDGRGAVALERRDPVDLSIVDVRSSSLSPPATVPPVAEAPLCLYLDRAPPG